MTSRERLIKAINGEKASRLPVTTHHLMPYFLNTCMEGMSNDAFFDHFGMDPIFWAVPTLPDASKGEFFNKDQEEPDQSGMTSSRYISSDSWQIEFQDIPGQKFKTIRYNFVTPKGTLSTVLQFNQYTSWVTEHLIKEKKDIELIGEFVTAPKCDIDAVNKIVQARGDRGIVRGHICCFDVFGQPGTWQDACCLVGIEKMIMETYDDPEWVHQLLTILKDRKKIYIDSLKGANYDILEFGGGDASSTVISPTIFDNFVAPYDTELIQAAHDAEQRIVYHTCGGMMPILENIVAMKPDAMETFTPSGMGGDIDLAQARKRIGPDMCMIGGIDQLHFFKGCTPEQTRREVRRCFEAAGQEGAFILCPSDHFFDADPELLMAFADEARQCTYE